MVVLLLPELYFYPSFVKCPEPVSVQALVAEFAIQTLDKGILRRFSGLDEAKLNTPLLAPEEERFAGKLSAVVTNDFPGMTALFAELGQEARHLLSADGHRDQLPHHFPRIIIDNIQHPKASAIGQLVGDEIHRPTLIDGGRNRRRLSWAGEFLASFGPYLKTFLGINPIGPLTVDHQAFGFEQAMQ